MTAAAEQSQELNLFSKSSKPNLLGESTRAQTHSSALQSLRQVFHLPAARLLSALPVDAIMNGRSSAVKAKFYSFVSYHRAWHPSYEGKTPYNVSRSSISTKARA